ncbi:MAG: HAD family hydrolase [Eubacteriales bacterium]|nr:HAD family hydrolase [Eubacteriales bacterium]MDD4582607.1 HAD family hydrolase [Eubacteriales bacterium]
MKYNTIIFDLDGTLLDTLDDLTDSVNEVLKQEGYQLRSKEEVRSFIGNGYRKLLLRALPTGTPDEEIDRCTAVFRKVYYDNMHKKTKPYDGIIDMLLELKKKDIMIGVVSNKLDEAVREGCRSFFGSYIDTAIGDNPNGKNKPAPDNLFEVMTRLNAHRKTTLYVGDSDIDVKTAQNAQIDFVGVTWGFRSRESLITAGADIIIDLPNELLGLLTQFFISD